MKKIIYTRPDGGVSIVNPSPRKLATFETEAEGMAAVRLKSIPPDATDVIELDEADIPTDFSFRNAWRQVGGVFTVDMPAARVLHRTAIDGARRQKARDLIEREMMGENVAPDKAALQAVDVTTQITAAKTPNALKAVWPAILGVQA